MTRWLRGGSLQRALERGPWNLEPATRLLSQVAGALAYAAHRQGVVHRDVEPANVLLDEDGNAYLSTSGSPPGSPLGRRGPSGHGDPAYVAPERPGALTPQSDLYGLGLLTFEVLTGRRRPPNERGPPVASHGPARATRRARRGRGIARPRPTPPKRYESVDRFVAAFVAQRPAGGR